MALGPDGSSRTRRGGMPNLVGLPPSTRRFVGRTWELEWDGRGREDRHRNPWLVGSGPEFPDGLLFIDFGGHTSGASRLTAHEALGSLLGLLKVPSEEIPADTTGRANLYQSQMRGKSVLLILDNVRSSDQIRALLPAEPKCRAIVTSRERLNGLDEAVRIPVGVLPAAEAAQLFLSCVSEHAEGPETGTIARIVEFCGHLPLAIRIAAAHLRSIPGCTLEDFIHLFTAARSRLDVINDGDTHPIWRELDPPVALIGTDQFDPDRAPFTHGGPPSVLLWTRARVAAQR
ncbi:hypothetical protein SAMN04489713_104327 [Actinomadura madurae]|uniref:Uncharacterized protein n=1 Tax=Actinomadura madurae TaxID=1993 RepID=A0A1I5EX76_9ACTN|nr:hypothetical protein SAMN04489713_104327 [Actinomadura madurae]